MLDSSASKVHMNASKVDGGVRNSTVVHTCNTVDISQVGKNYGSSLDLKRIKCGTAWCSMVNCRNNRLKNRSLSFFKFPLDPVRSKKWVIASGRKDLMDKDFKYLYNNCKICGEHFESVMFLNDLKNRLQKHAIPVKCCGSKSSLSTQFKMVIPEKRAPSHCKRLAVKELNIKQEPLPMIEKAWIKCEIPVGAEDEVLDKVTNTPKVDVEESCNAIFNRMKQTVEDFGQQRQDSLSLPRLVVEKKLFIKEECYEGDDLQWGEEYFLPLKVEVKEEITDEIFEAEN